MRIAVTPMLLEGRRRCASFTDLTERKARPIMPPRAHDAVQHDEAQQFTQRASRATPCRSVSALLRSLDPNEGGKVVGMRSLLAIAFLALGPVAAAADLTPTLLKYIVGQVPPQEESEIISGTRSRVWDNPSGLQVERLLFAYAYGMSSEHWSVMLFNPKAPRTDYLGTRDVSFVGRTTGSAATDVYRVNAGRFKGFIVQDFKDAKDRMLILHTPKVALESYKLARFVRP